MAPMASEAAKAMMRISAYSKQPRVPCFATRVSQPLSRGFTLLEILLVATVLASKWITDIARADF